MLERQDYKSGGACMMDSLEKTRKYHELKNRIPGMVSRDIPPKDIIYGARALNRQVPPYLWVQTTDYDVYAGRPKALAQRIEKDLDKRMGFDAFGVYPAQHKGTWRVRSKQTGTVYADVTVPPKTQPPFRVLGRHRYVTLPYIRKVAEGITKDPEYEFRHPHEKDVINRIRLVEQRRRR
jgi:hypothetical protein